MGSDTTIEALALESFDRAPEVIHVPAPQPAAGEVLVRVHAASVNAFDSFVAMGMAKAFMPYEFPAVMGQDVAGVVEAVGDGVEGFRNGDRVFGTIGSKGVVHDGTFHAARTGVGADPGGGRRWAGWIARRRRHDGDERGGRDRPVAWCDGAHRRGDGRRRDLRDPARSRSRRERDRHDQTRR